MTSRDFPQANITIAKDQKEYAPLRAHRSPEGVVTSCWEPNSFELELIKQFLADGRAPHFYVSQLTFGKPLQPLCVQMGFDPPSVPAPAPEVEASHAATVPAAAAKQPTRLAAIAACKGMSGPLLWAMDKESKPGVAICHFVRLETQHLTDTAEPVSFAQMHPDHDPRLAFLADSFATADTDAKLKLMQVLVMAYECMEQVKAQAILKPGAARFLEDTHKLMGLALAAYGARKAT